MPTRNYSREELLSIYFGLPEFDKTVNYLQDDVRENFKSQLRVLIISEILKLTSSEISGEAAITDWDYYDCAIDLLKALRVESLVSIRLLLSTERYNKDGRERAPLTGSLPGSQTMGSFIKDIINLADDDLLKQIDEYKKADYYNELIKDNEAILLHKNKRPDKRFLKTVELNHYGTVRHYQSNTNFDTETIITSMETVAKIIILFLKDDMNKVQLRYINNIEQYVDNYFKLFLPNNDNLVAVQKLTKSIRRTFPNTLTIIGWK